MTVNFRLYIIVIVRFCLGFLNGTAIIISGSVIEEWGVNLGGLFESFLFYSVLFLAGFFSIAFVLDGINLNNKYTSEIFTQKEWKKRFGVRSFISVFCILLIFFGTPEYLKLFGVFLATLFFVACILSQIKFILDGYSYRPAQ